jgi:hypothetical protein
MKAKGAGKNDPAVRAHDAMFGERQQKNPGRVKLVMSLAALIREIDCLEMETIFLKNCVVAVIKESKLTESETKLLDFEIGNGGV